MKRLSLAFAFAMCAFAQQPEWDTSGNGLLSGSYNFREALWITDLEGSNELFEAAGAWGTITFDGRGNYTMSATDFSSRTNSQRPYARSGTYAISASGYGFIRRDTEDGDFVYGSVSNGVFIGSGTESGFNNLFVAARQGTPTTGTFNQRYNVVYTNLATANLTQVRDASFQLNPNGSGGLGTVNAVGFAGASYTQVSQTINNASYSFAGGIGTLNLGTRNTTDLVTGSLQMYVSADGGLIFGGSTNGWDIFVGVRAATAAPPFNGLYYQAGMDVRRDALPDVALLTAYQGAVNVIDSIKSVIGHQRIQTAPDAPYEYTYSDVYSLNSSGSHDDFMGLVHFVSPDGNLRVGYGRGDYLGVNVAIKAPALSGSGVYLNPTGVVNAASFTPFTTGIAPGELITLFGNGLANTSTNDSTFPLTLAGVTVRVNGRQAPIYVVSPTQLSAIVPYDTPAGIAEIQVNNNGANSNRVTVYVNRTAPGVFAVPPTGLGYAAALHPDYSLVSSANPARPGEIIQVYLTGLGITNPRVNDGAPGPTDPLAETTEFVDASIGGLEARIVYSGLAPTLRGLYQVNVEVPVNVGSGDQYLDIRGPDALSSQILLPITGPRSSAAVPQRSLRTRKGFAPSNARSASARPSSVSPSRSR